MKTWLVVVSVVAVILAASTGVGFWMLASTQAELTSTQAELTGAQAELTECRENGVGSNVQITYIFYDGVVYRTESDEYVEITNLGDTSQDLEGWVLMDISEGYPSLIFPSYILQPGESIRVYTNEIHSEYGGFSFGFGKAVWNNSSPDTAVLKNAQGQEVSRKSY